MNKTTRALSAVTLMCALILTPAFTSVSHKADAQVKTATPVSSSEIATPVKEGENETGSIFDIADTMKLGSEATHKAQAVSYKKYWKVPLSHNLQDYVGKLCKEDGVSEQLAYGVMNTESKFNPNLVSTTDDYGLMQINAVNRPWLAKKFGITDWFNPYQNAEAGIYMLGQLVHKYHYENLVAIAYNEGEGGMLNTVQHGVYSTDYSIKVMDYHPRSEWVKE